MKLTPIRNYPLDHRMISSSSVQLILELGRLLFYDSVTNKIDEDKKIEFLFIIFDIRRKCNVPLDGKQSAISPKTNVGC